MVSFKIKVLIVDDTQVMRLLLSHLLASDPRIEVIGMVDNGQAALDFVLNQRVKPDVVLMDIHMPDMDGFEATRRIMETQPLPIVICTATADPQEVAVAFRSMEAGAVACVEKPVSPEHPDFQRHTQNLLQTLRLMSEVKVVRRWPRRNGTTQPAAEFSGARHGMAASASQSTPNHRTHGAPPTRVIGIGASTGGPPVLQTILSSLPKDFSLPILIVQHIARGFLPGLVEWLDQTTGLRVHIAAHGTHPLAGHAYIAPDEFHLGLGSNGRIVLARDPEENGLRPAVSYLFRTLALNAGANAVGVLLTGMGKDGALELKLMKDHGALTIAQDRESSIVHGMPGEAIALGGASQVLAADKIAGALIALANHRVMPGGIA